MTNDLHIQLQTSDVSFDKSFIDALPAFEAEMVMKDLDPSDFILAKNHCQFPVPFVGFLLANPQYDYTVFVDGKSFTVTKPNDTIFLEYFASICFAPDDVVDREKKHPHVTLIERLERWLTGTPDILQG